MNRKTVGGAAARFLRTVGQEVFPALRLASVSAVACGIAIILSQFYMSFGYELIGMGVPYVLELTYILLGIGIGLGAFSYLSERDNDRFYKLLPASPLRVAAVKAVVTVLFCAVFISVTVCLAYEVCKFTPRSNYGYVKNNLELISGGRYGLLELRGALGAFFYGFSVGAFCSAVFSRVAVATAHALPFLAVKLLLSRSAEKCFAWQEVNSVGRPLTLRIGDLISPELGLLSAIYNSTGKDAHRIWLFEKALWVNGALILLAAFIIIAYRRGEHSGRVFADGRLYPVYALPFSFGAAAVFEYFRGSFEYRAVWDMDVSVRYALTALAVFLFLGILGERNIKRWWRPLAIGCVAAVFTVCYYGVLIEFTDEVKWLMREILH